MPKPTSGRMIGCRKRALKLYRPLVVKDWNIGGVSSGYRDYSAECGAFVLDDMSFSSTPDTLTMGGVAKPNDTSFSERNRTFAWKKTSVKKIAETIARRYGWILSSTATTTTLTPRNRMPPTVHSCRTSATPTPWLSRSTLQSCGSMTGRSTKRRMRSGRYTRRLRPGIRPRCAWSGAASSGVPS